MTKVKQSPKKLETLLGFVQRGTHRAPGTNQRKLHHPVTNIFVRRFPKSKLVYV